MTSKRLILLFILSQPPQNVMSMNYLFYYFFTIENQWKIWLGSILYRVGLVWLLHWLCPEEVKCSRTSPSQCLESSEKGQISSPVKQGSKFFFTLPLCQIYSIKKVFKNTFTNFSQCPPPSLCLTDLIPPEILFVCAGSPPARSVCRGPSSLQGFMVLFESDWLISQPYYYSHRSYFRNSWQPSSWVCKFVSFMF